MWFQFYHVISGLFSTVSNVDREILMKKRRLEGRSSVPLRIPLACFANLPKKVVWRLACNVLIKLFNQFTNVVPFEKPLVLHTFLPALLRNDGSGLLSMDLIPGLIYKTFARYYKMTVDIKADLGKASLPRLFHILFNAIHNVLWLQDYIILDSSLHSARRWWMCWRNSGLCAAFFGSFISHQGHSGVFLPTFGY